MNSRQRRAAAAAEFNELRELELRLNGLRREIYRRTGVWVKFTDTRSMVNVKSMISECELLLSAGGKTRLLKIKSKADKRARCEAMVAKVIGDSL